MAKRLSIQKTVTPPEWNGRKFNIWQRHIQRQLDKLKNTDLAGRYKVN